MIGQDSLRRTRKLWLMNGGTAEIIQKTGEERFTHPLEQRSIVINRRRKDSTQQLSGALRRIMRNT